MKFSRNPLFFLAAAASLAGIAPVAAQTYYWRGGAGEWTNAGNWSGAVDGSTAGAVPAGADAVFNIDGFSGDQTVTLGSDGPVASLRFRSAGITSILGPAAATNLEMGAGGITLETGTGGAIIGSGANAGGVRMRIGADQTWSNQSSGELVVRNSVAPSSATGGDRILTLGGTGTIRLSQIIEDTVVGPDRAKLSLVKTGNGLLDLSGSLATTYTGGLTIRGGTVSVNADNRLGASNSLVTIDGGTLQVTGNITTGAGVRPMTIGAAGGTIEVTGGTQFRHDGTIDGDGMLTKTGSGTLWLVNAKTHTGGTAFNGGDVYIFADDRLGSGGLSFNGGTLRSSGTFTMNRATTLNAGGGTFNIETDKTVTQQGAITGGGSLSKTGTGALALRAASDYTGGTTISEGVLDVNGTNRLGSGTLTIDGGRLRLSFDTGAGPYFTQSTVLGASGGGIEVTGSNTVRYDGGISGGTLTKSGSGTLYLVGGKTYSGGTVFNGGTVLVYDNDRLGTGGLTFNGGSLRSNGTFTMNRATTLLAGGGTLNIDGSQTVTQDGVISGEGSFSKSGGGNAVLTADNTYTGSTIVNGGVLEAKGTLNSSTSLQVNGGTFRFGASDIINNNAEVTLGAGTLQVGDFSDTLGKLAVAGAATVDFSGNVGSTIVFADSRDKAWTGSLTVLGWTGLVEGGGEERLMFGDGTGGLEQPQVDSIFFVNPSAAGLTAGTYSAKMLASGEVVPHLLIPEPSSALLVLLGAGLAVRRRR
ncbi:autotransporter-associated beta strand repeat-containing protein [Luteolibacter sp. SL250]|uniref:autotransporter-associated beta strand repeat-containing protein n=1 Tax=Luteolibacter sp. SL250 TaxID=2995170 RepID=UPI0022709F97|nr:autotransporter-associated beta strand repeat-containing protein [Luteolibacter sp. SL250]WAC20173.1 autotransporter-associated beta strand repeat-containing protein [Luteolibacter sp. SL250]